MEYHALFVNFEKKPANKPAHPRSLLSVSVHNSTVLLFVFFIFQFRSKEVRNEYNYSITVPYNESAENKTLYDIDEGKVFNVTFNLDVNGTIESITKRKY